MAAGMGRPGLRRDRLIVLVGLAAISALSWAYTYTLAADMAVDVASAPRLVSWTATDVALTFVMWVIMMVAMMTPSAAPMVLAFTNVQARDTTEGSPLPATGLFLLGYLLAWTAFSLLATVGQWGLHVATLLSPMLVVTSPLLGGALLVAAGLFQFTPLKEVCLAHCRTPLGFLLTEWRDGPAGALVMGLRHGRFCLGCCWFLMVLLFVAGVMNLLWVAAIAVFVLVEKAAPAGPWISRVAGVLLAGWGVYVLAEAVSTIV